jgi:hypothetical protein
MTIQTSGEWKEERLFVLHELDRINEENKILRTKVAVLENKIDGKGKQDMDQAHRKIRDLEAKVKNARLKTWAAISAASFLATVVLQLVRYVLR